MLAFFLDSKTKTFSCKRAGRSCDVRFVSTDALACLDVAVSSADALAGGTFNRY